MDCARGGNAKNFKKYKMEEYWRWGKKSETRQLWGMNEWINEGKMRLDFPSEDHKHGWIGALCGSSVYVTCICKILSRWEQERSVQNNQAIGRAREAQWNGNRALNNVMPNWGLQHLWTWPNHLHHAVGILVNLKCRYCSNVLCCSDRWTLFHVHLEKTYWRKFGA